jgi:hypothetical protein
VKVKIIATEISWGQVFSLKTNLFLLIVAQTISPLTANDLEWTGGVGGSRSVVSGFEA